MSFRKRVFLALLFALILLVFLNSRDSSSLRYPGDSFLVRLYGPVLSGMDRGKDAVVSTWRRYVALVGAGDENRRLKEELKSKNLLILFLKEKIASDFRQEGLEGIAARVVAFDPHAQTQSVWVDAGSRKGVKMDSPAVTKVGLAGRVIKIFPKMSQVLLVTDRHFSVDVLNERTRVRALAVGSGNRAELRRGPLLSHLEFLKQGDDMRPGDLLLTSGLGEMYPAGIPVGTLLKGEAILPKVDFSSLEEVMILDSHPERSEGSDSSLRSE
ncbi:MAG: rod shape-determining protein MreC [Deltaproteobacteria bacterium]|nr:rod shape-determining protein MreC [Deltaproteobacteria bacterium]